MIWYSGVCGVKPPCYIECETNPDGTLSRLIVARACVNHSALNGKPELYYALRVEGGTMSHAVETIKTLAPTAAIGYSFDASRALTVSVSGTAVPKSTLQSAVDSLLGAGKVTVV